MAKSELEKLRDSLTKRYGKERVNSWGSYVSTSTGSIALDIALRTGGWVQGRLHEIVGAPNVGKTSLMMASIAEQQIAYPDKAVVYIDVEQTFRPEWAENFGVELNPDKFTHIYPEHSEDVSNIIREVSASSTTSAVIIDSIGGMESKAAIEKDAEDSAMGRGAMVITRMLKHVAPLARKHGVTILMVNQFRANMGSAGGYGPAEVSAGPKILPYAESIKVRLSRGAEPRKVRIDGEDIEVAHQIKAKVEKNKLAPGGRTAAFYLIKEWTEDYGPVGIDRVEEAVNVGVMTGAIERRGAWYTLPNGDRIQSRDSVIEVLNKNPELTGEIREAALKTLKDSVYKNEKKVEYQNEDGESFEIVAGEEG